MDIAIEDYRKGVPKVRRRRIILSVSKQAHDRIKQYCDQNDYFIGGWCSAVLQKHISEMEKKGELK